MKASALKPSLGRSCEPAFRVHLSREGPNTHGYRFPPRVLYGFPRFCPTFCAVSDGFETAPRATDDGNKDEAAHLRGASLALWRSHCQAAIGPKLPTSLTKICCALRPPRGCSQVP